MLLRDRLLARLAEMGSAPDHQRLAAEVLGIRNAPPDLARRLVSQALVVEDRSEAWRRIGERICARAPATPGVYVLSDEAGRVLYVGKAVNLRRRLRAHFASRRWRGIKAELARAADAEWREVGSELEGLLREAALIHELDPLVNVQVGPPAAGSRAIPQALVRDVIVVLPSVEGDSAELVCARPDGEWLIQRTRRNGDDLAVHAARLTRFFNSPLRQRFQEETASSARDARHPAARARSVEDPLPLREGLALAPIVFSWLAGRGTAASRIDPHAASPRQLRDRLRALLSDERLFNERIIIK